MTTTIGNKETGSFYGLDFSTQLAMHGLRRDNDGNLIYSKVSMIGNETANLSNGQGPAFEGMEEFVKGVTASGVAHNSVPVGVNEFSRKNFLGQDYTVKVENPLSGNPEFILNNQRVDQIDIVSGATYKFITTDPSTQGFPLYISTQPQGNEYLYEYLSGVENSRSSYGGTEGDIRSNTTEPLTFTVPENAPAALYLASGNHAGVYITMHVNRQPHANLKNRYYHQVKFDDARVTYYLNSDGYLVARYNQTYTY